MLSRCKGNKNILFKPYSRKVFIAHTAWRAKKYLLLGIPERRGTVNGGGDGDDVALLVELHLVDAHLAVHSGTAFLAVVDEVFVDAVIDDVPLVLAGYLEHAVVGCAVDALLWHLTQHVIVLGVDGERT